MSRPLLRPLLRPFPPHRPSAAIPLVECPGCQGLVEEVDMTEVSYLEPFKKVSVTKTLCSECASFRCTCCENCVPEDTLRECDACGAESVCEDCGDLCCMVEACTD